MPVASEQVRTLFASELDTACFLKWLDRVDIRLKHEGWVMPEDLPELIANEKKERDSRYGFSRKRRPYPR